MSKSDKLYAKSPKIEKDDKGKPGIKKPSTADAENMGTEGNDIEGAGDGMPVDVHQQERASMHKRHEEEQKSLHETHHKALGDMHSRHEKDLKEMHKRHSESEKTEKTGGEEITKTEEDKKE